MPSFDVQALIQMPRVGKLVASDRRLVFEVQTLDPDHGSRYLTHLWQLPEGEEDALALTRGRFSDSSPAHWRGGELLFLSTRPPEGAEQEDHKDRAQLWRFPPGGGDPSTLTDLPFGVSAFATALDADRLMLTYATLPKVPRHLQRETAKERKTHGPTALHYTESPVRHWDHWLPMTHTIPAVLRGQELLDLPLPGGIRYDAHTAMALSPDGRTGALTRRTREGSYGLFDVAIDLWDLDTLTLTHTVWHPGHSYHDVCFSPDSTRLACSRFILGPSQGLYATDVVWFEVKDPQPRPVILSKDLEFEPSVFRADGTLVGLADWRGTRGVFRLDLDSGEVEAIAPLQGSHAHVCALPGEGETFASVHSSLLEPPAPTLWGSRDPDIRRITTLCAEFDPASWARVEAHEAPSTDALPCPYHVVRPAHQAQAHGGTLMWIHGGPISQWADTWHWRWNSLIGVARGWTMVLPNPRGSTGYGRTWVEGIWGNVWGGQCYEDLMAVADQVEATEGVLPGKFAAMGGSFGGYMTNWIGTQTDRFACLVNHAGLAQFGAFIDVTDTPAWWVQMFGIDLWKDRAALETYSPLSHLAGWRSPVLIVHGDRDYRVPVSEALALFHGLQAHGVPSELLIYPDENHWILRPRNIVSWYTEIFAFLEHHTLGEQKEAQTL